MNINNDSRYGQLMYEFDEASQLAHSQGNIKPIEKLFKQQNLVYDNVDKSYLGEALLVAIDNSYLDIIKYILTSPDLKYHPTNPPGENILIIAAKEGNLEMFEFFKNRFELDYPDKKIAVIYHESLGVASEKGHINIVKYIMEQDEASPHLERFRNHSLQWACMRGHVNLVKFHLSVDDRQMPVQFFMSAITASHFDLINFFIFELKIDECEEIKDYLEMFSGDNTDKVKCLFRTRDLKNDLDKELINKEVINIRKNKI